MRINWLFCSDVYPQHENLDSQINVNHNDERRKKIISRGRKCEAMPSYQLNPRLPEVGMDCPAFHDDAALFLYFWDMVGGFESGCCLRVKLQGLKTSMWRGRCAG